MSADFPDDSKQCVGPANIHTLSTEGIRISWGMGGSVRLKKIKELYEAYLKFPEGWGGVLKKSFPWGRYGYFKEVHNMYMYNLQVHAIGWFIFATNAQQKQEKEHF